ncbi:concanavalin A-like lectin/glucanase domain-containing protein [Protomyces lactucae-debilis]|uniref:Concanavalin A-like lectin/glucanase domain-containing protein n=1 Tax=Protomyces lactucae-debilis TaxID=2754530 RepID=A0A1Y2FNJ6_PROLT|nr:concanavalin A-like lectin/glucanase domain-containing protein [Protomyces lactucae-debilis]ORY85571.1 concanavalin A-like lectin/glucanase domain-containing protein [Protomyces lactucae-debilis]
MSNEFRSIENDVLHLGITTASLAESFSDSSVSFDGTLAASHRYRRRTARTRPSVLGQAPAEKPWLNIKMTRSQKFSHRLPYISISLALLVVAGYCYSGYSQVDRHKYCLVVDDDFSNGFNPNVWQLEQQLDGFGVGSFDWTTDSPENSFIKDNRLHIQPTLQTQYEQVDGNVLNLTETGKCQGFGDYACAARVNSTTSDIINPVQSARITTRNQTTIRYGKVEVRAKMPKGLWLWPQIALLPKDLHYGQWPASGELSIFESWGNDPSKRRPSNKKMVSQIWSGTDGSWVQSRSVSKEFKLPRGDFSDEFHTFGLVWSQDAIYTYIDNFLMNVLTYKVNKPNQFWIDGGLSNWLWGGTCANFRCNVNPYIGGSPIAPYDQDFFLSLSLRVGGLNGWFPDGGAKPWTNNMNHTAAMTTFLAGKHTWLPSWNESAMVIDSVKMWKQCS